MTDAGRAALVVLSLLCAAILFHRALASPPVLGPPHPASPCSFPVERAGEGVVCLDEAEEDQARRSGIEAGDRVAVIGAGTGSRIEKIGRMAPSRLELFAVPIDVNAAPVEELASLAGIGPHLAERIAAARPFASIQDVGAIKGIGARKIETLAPRLRLRPPSMTQPAPVVVDGGAQSRPR